MPTSRATPLSLLSHLRPKEKGIEGSRGWGGHSALWTHPDTLQGLSGHLSSLSTSSQGAAALRKSRTHTLSLQSCSPQWGPGTLHTAELRVGTRPRGEREAGPAVQGG